MDGWGVRIRTFIRGVKARCPTVERRPSDLVGPVGIEPTTLGLHTTSSLDALTVCGLDYTITLVFLVRVQPL